MATLTKTPTSETQVGYPAHTRTLDTIVGILTLLLVLGLFIDGWAHNHGRVDESFFTPYHAMMYSSYALFGAFLVGLHFYNVNRGYRFWRALPQGYLISLIGVFIFGFGGLADMLWHTAFGIEQDIEALYSPSHLILAIGYCTVIGGVIQSAWIRRDVQQGWRDLWWLIIAATSFLSILTFLVQYMTSISLISELVFSRGGDGTVTHLAISNYLINTGLMLSTVLFLMRRWRLPSGAVTVIFTLNSLFMGVMLVFDYRGFDPAGFFALMGILVIPGLLAGLVSDVIIQRMNATPQTPYPARIVATIAGFLLSGISILAIHLYGDLYGGGLWWQINAWLGIPILCGLIGLLLSLLVFPPAIPQESHSD